MKIAITADNHLTDKKKHPERWKTFENILNDISEKNINKIIICGDLFNENYRNYSEFDKLTDKYNNIDFFIIPGNHDSNINEKAITGSNVTIYTEPEFVSFDNTLTSFFFLPYKPKITMGDQLASYREALKPKEWILIGHGDWADSIQTPNPIEPGVYMPLSRKDIRDYKPALTILGHIHKPTDDLDYNVHHIGSPCGLDITETGRRRYLILDTKTLNLEQVDVESEIIYFDEIITVYPMEDEEAYLNAQINDIKRKWDLKPEEKATVKIRIKVKGYSSNIRKLKAICEEGFKGYSFWNNEETDTSEVYVSDNYELLKITEKVVARIDQQSWVEIEGEPIKSEIISKAIKTIYSIS
ncbi:metallophosphoesterase [candidate division WOR-3 bacterium]|nr:metallophosphoesterase [candidate division WOR-3 bacterium]